MENPKLRTSTSNESYEANEGYSIKRWRYIEITTTSQIKL